MATTFLGGENIKRLGVAMVMSLIAVSAQSPSQAQAQSSELVFADGTWTGSLFFTATVLATDASGYGSGFFTLTSEGGVVSGEASWGAEVSSSAGQSEAFVQGPIDGTAARPVLHADEIITGRGFIVDNRGAAGLELTITSATCEMLEGTGSGFAPVDLDSFWTATRATGGLDPDAFGDSVSSLAAQVVQIEQQLAAGGEPDRWTLFNAVSIAEALSQTMERSEECGGSSPGHRIVVAGLIARLLAAVSSGGLDVDNAWFVDLMMAAAATGAIGPGASDPGAADLELDAIAELLVRIEAAAAAGDSDGLLELAVLADQMGYRSALDAALGALEAAA